MIILRVIVTSCWVIMVHSYCEGIGNNPGWRDAPKVEQLSLTAVRLSWEGLLTRAECADQLIVKSWNSRNPNDYKMSDLLDLSTTSHIVTDIVPNQEHVFQMVAREDKGILGKDWHKGPKAYFMTSKHEEKVVEARASSTTEKPEDVPAPTQDYWCGYQPSWSVSEWDGPNPGYEEVKQPLNDRTLTFGSQKEYDYDSGYDRNDDYNLPPANTPTTSNLNLETGIFTAPTSKMYMVTVTAMISGMGKYDQSYMSSYAQLFLMKNGKLDSLENYLLVEEDKVAELRVNMDLHKGDTLSLYVGHNIWKQLYSGSSGGQFTAYGFNIEQVRFCIF